MNMPICSRCKKNIAVVFISKMDGSNESSQEGLCIKCAREMGVKPLDNIMEQMGITEDDLEALAGELGSEINSIEDLTNLMPTGAGDIGSDGAGEEHTSDADSKPSGVPSVFGPMSPQRMADNVRTRAQTPPKKDDKKRKFLNNYCEDLTAKAREGRVDHIVGRDRETERVIQILNRRQKNNPCLIGEPGVGKTAVAEGLAVRIAEGRIPFKLRDKEVHLLDLTALVAGTQFRGQFESRMKGLIDEIKRLGNIILVVDEVHNIVGAGDSEGSMNAANILKPALSRGEIQVIGATTFSEYRKYIEKDAALERRFQPVHIGEPNVEETAEILKGIRSYYETFHGVTVSDAICEMAAQMSERYITDRFLPDKAIDLLDEACSKLNLSSPQLSEIPILQSELESLQRQLDLLSHSVQTDENDETYARIASCRSRMLQVESRLHELLSKPAPALSEQQLAAVVEIWTGIPASKIQAQEGARLTQMEARLNEKVIGQETAVSAISAAIRRSRAGISPKKKPVSFLFVGPTGVGKTELVKQLTLDLFDSPDALIRLDMSEYMEKHSVSRLIGSPPGYVGYDEAGQLTEKVRRRPYSVILMDEIEKAHPDILNTLLQILDDGRLSDAQGRVVNFENTVIVMTSNAGSSNSSSVVGFGKSVTEQSADKARRALEELMRPEFLNRIDEVISFNQLSESDFRRIATLMLTELQSNVARREIRVTWDDGLLDYLTEKSFSVKFGARNLRRFIEKEIENKLATLIVSTQQPLAGAHIRVEHGEIAIDTI